MDKTPLRILREKRGLTTTQVADAVGVNQGHYSRIENGQGGSPEMAARIAEYFGREFITELHILYPERYASEPPKKARAAA
jgi:transcriptional regulator with XRE-family HTH domain